jgi:predicted ATPase
MLHEHRRERQLTQERIGAALTLSTEHGFSHWVALGTIVRGWALAEEGQGEEGITQLRQGIATWRATGAEAQRSYFLALLAEVYGKAGQVEEGLATLTEALTMVDNRGERVYEAELYRLKGTLTLQFQTSLRQVTDKSNASQNKSENPSPQPLTPSPQAEAEAEGYFLKAIEIAQRQQAKSLELRAATSLARLWQQQGKTDNARQMLTEVYGWFTEGFDTNDLQAAQALLGELH